MEAVAPPLNLPDTATLLTSPEGIRVILLGSAHVSRKSVEDVRKIVADYRPHCVFLELCRERRSMLVVDPNAAPSAMPMTLDNLRSQYTSAGIAGVLSLAVSTLAVDATKQLGIDIQPGAEFAAAAQAVGSYGGIVVLGDRGVSITLKRLWAALSFWEKCKIIYEFVFRDLTDLDEDMLERLKTTDFLTEIIQEVAKEIPSVIEPLITERDYCMTFVLKNTCSRLAEMQAQQHAGADPEGITVLAVVGMGHRQGIIDLWSQDQDKETFHRLSEPPRRSLADKAASVAKLLVASTVVIGTVYVGWRAVKRVL